MATADRYHRQIKANGLLSVYLTNLHYLSEIKLIKYSHYQLFETRPIKEY